jgi:hypothetical protein
VRRVIIEENEELFPPAHEPGALGWHRCLPAHVVGRLVEIEFVVGLGHFDKRLGNVRLVHLAEIESQAAKSFSQRFIFDAFVDRDMRHVLGFDVEDDDLLAQHLVMLQMMNEHEYRRAERSSRTTWRVSEKTPEITAPEAIRAAMVASTTSG